MQGLRSWLLRRGLIGDCDSISEADLATAHVLRSSLRESIAAHADDAGGGVTPPVRISARLPLDVTADAQGRLMLGPRSPGIRAALSLVLIQAVTGGATGTWLRLKMCGAADCHWIFFDASKPRTARWCETDVCGNRIKMTNQRQRRRRTANGAE